MKASNDGRVVVVAIKCAFRYAKQMIATVGYRGQHTNTTSVHRPIQHHSTAVQRPVHNQYSSASANTNTSTAVQRPVHNSVHQYLGQYNTWFARVYGCRTPFASPTYHTADRHRCMALCENPKAVHAVTQDWRQNKGMAPWPPGFVYL